MARDRGNVVSLPATTFLKCFRLSASEPPLTLSEILGTKLNGGTALVDILFLLVLRSAPAIHGAVENHHFTLAAIEGAAVWGSGEH